MLVVPSLAASTPPDSGTPPFERLDQGWHLLSFADDASLAERTAYDIDFERAPASARPGTVWLATSDGLREYDGYTWKRHGRDRGIPTDAVRCVHITKSGTLWIGTDQGLGTFETDGFHPRNPSRPANELAVRRLVEDSSGTLWTSFGGDAESGTGGVLGAYRDGRWQLYGPAEGLPAEGTLGFLSTGGGNRFLVHPRGISQWTGGATVSDVTPPAEPETRWSEALLVESAQPGLLCATPNQLFAWRGGTWETLPPALNQQVGLCGTADGRLFAVALNPNARAWFLEWRTNGWTRRSAEFRLPRGSLNAVREAPNGALWAVGPECAFVWQRRSAQWREFAACGIPQCIDASNRVWFVNRVSESVIVASPSRRDGIRWNPVAEPASAIVRDPTDGSVWGWTDSQLTHWQGAKVIRFTPRETGLATNHHATVDGRGRLWLAGTDARGRLAASRRDERGWQPVTLPQLSQARWHNAAAATEDTVGWIAEPEQEAGAILLLLRPDRVSPIAIPAGLVGHTPLGLHLDRRGTPWLYGDAGLHRWRLPPEQSWETIPGYHPADCVERGDELWFGCVASATSTAALVRYQNGEWSPFRADLTGPLALARDGTLLAGGEGRFYLVAPGTNTSLVEVELPVGRRTDRVLRDDEGHFWMGVQGRALLFRPDSFPPTTLVFGPARIFADERFEALGEAVEPFRPRQTRRDHRFSWRLDDGAWTSPSPSRRFVLEGSQLPARAHRLEVRAMDSGGDQDPASAVLDFQVLPLPLQNRPWFMPLTAAVVVLLVASVAFSLQARARVASHARTLEARVAERTAAMLADSTRRKEAELAALEGEERFAKAFHSSPVMSALSTFPQGRYLDINRLFTETLGYSREEIIGHTHESVGLWLHPEQRATLVAAAARGEIIRSAECQVRAKSGDVRTILAAIERVELAGQPAILFAAVDITERKRSEEALRRSDDRLKLALGSSRMGVWEWEIRSGRMFCSPECDELIGVSETIGRLPDFMRLVHPDDIEAVVDAARKAIATRERLAVEFRLLRPNGQLVWIAILAQGHHNRAGRPVRMIGTARDVTERRRYENLLNGQNRILQKIAHRVPLRETLHRLLQVVEDQSPEMFSSILLLDASGRHLHHAAGPRIPDAYRQAIDGFSIGPTAGSCGTAAFRREAVFVENIENDPLWVDFRAVALPHGFRSCWSTPIFDTQHNVLGTFAIYHRHPSLPVAHDRELIELVTNTAAIAVIAHRAELALREREEQLRVFVEHAPAAIAMLDRDLRYLGASYRWLHDFGLTGSDWRGRSHEELFPALPAQWPDIRQRCLAGEVKRADEEAFQRPDGSRFWLRWEVRPWYTAEDSVGGLIIFNEDITRRKEADSAIQERLNLEQRLARVAATVPGAVFAYQVDADGQSSFPYMSPKIRELAGLHPDEVQTSVDYAFRSVVPEDLPGLLASVRQSVASGQPWQRQFRIRHPQRGLVWIEGRSEPVPLRDGRALFHGFLIDVTQRRRSEQRRATEHAVTRVLAEAGSLAEATPRILRAVCESEGWQFGALWELDSSLGTLECVASWCNPDPRFEALSRETAALRLPPGSGLPGRVWVAGEPVVLPDISQEPGFLRGPAAQAAGLHSAVGFPVKAGGRMIAVVDFLGADPVESNRETEDSLAAIGTQIGQFIASKTVQERLQRFVALSPAVLYAQRITPSGLRFMWASDNLHAMTGYSLAEFIEGNRWLEGVHPEDRARVQAAHPLPYSLDQQVLEFRFVRQDGSFFWVRDEKRLSRDAEGRPAEIVGAWLDITERVKLEAQLRQAQKMEAIGLLSGGIAHDFNNILGSISGNSELARFDIGPDHPATESLVEIQTATQRAAALVRQILAFSRREHPERHRISLLPIVQESIRLLRAAIPSGVRLTGSVIGDPPEILADETQIQQAIVNLGTNAWHALEDRPGHIIIEVSGLDLDEALVRQHPDLRPGRYLRLRVRDDGKGMDSKILDRIFDPFFTTKAPGKGTGLGLSVVHGIVKNHGGAILVTSAPGQGATFDLYFPAAPDAAAAPKTTARTLRRGSGQSVVIIDDEAPMARAVSRALERIGYSVETHLDPRAAVETIARDPARYDLVLTDLNMPGASGVDVARQIRALRADLPILLTSGYLTDEVHQEATAAGICGVLRKPASLEDLGEAVYQATRGAAGRKVSASATAPTSSPASPASDPSSPPPPPPPPAAPAAS